MDTLTQKATERLNSWEDILTHHNKTQEQFDTWCAGLRPHEVGNRMEEMIVAAYNGRQLDDPLPDWSDGTAKGWPWFYMSSPSGGGFRFDAAVNWHSTSFVGARLVFYGPHWRENLHDAVSKFLPQYEQSRTL